MNRSTANPGRRDTSTRRVSRRPVALGLAWLLALGLGLAAPTAAAAEDTGETTAPAAQPEQPKAEQQPKPEPETAADEQPQAEAEPSDETPGAEAKPEAEPDEQAAEDPEPSPEPDETAVPPVEPPVPQPAAPSQDARPADPSEPPAPEPSGDPVEAPVAPAPAEVELRAFAVSPLAGTPGTSADNGDGTSTYTYWDGETVTYPATVTPGEPIRVTGAGWLTVPGHPQVDEGDEGSVIGFKFMPAAGSVMRKVHVPNPRTGEADYPSPDVWDIVQAAGSGEWWGGATPGTWRIDIPWPSADLAQNPPTLAAGDAITLQLLSGTLYSNEVCSGGCQRPDVSRTIALRLTVAGDPTAAPAFTRQPGDVTVTAGADARFTVAVTGSPEPALQWESATSASGEWVAIPGATATTLTLAAVTQERSGHRVRAVATNAAGRVESDPAVLTVRPAATVAAPVVTGHPQDAARTEGELVTFSAEATGAPAPTVRWQRSTDAGATWQDLRGATGKTFTIGAVSTKQNGQRFRAVFTNASAPNGVPTRAATLTVTPRAIVREHCGTSYGPGAVNSGIPFCYRGPDKVVAGQPIVIEGVGGYLATDDRTGSVVNFFLDAEYSGDPNTVFAKRLFTNPATGQQISDRRTHAIVQADSRGTWRVEIPWPRVDSVSPTSDGKGSYTPQQLAAKFAPGTTHSLRMLTGSLMNEPADRQRGASLYFTVVESLTDEVSVAKPPYEHQTFASDAAGDRATAWVQQQVNSGQRIGLTGTGWLTADRQWGSTVTLRLQREDGTYYRRTGKAGDRHADPADPTVWQVLQATEDGELDTRVPLPTGVAGGGFVAVELTTTADGTPLSDVARRWVSEPLTIDNVPYVHSPGEGATCTAAPGAATYELAPGMAVPAANVGGTIRLTGRNWCNLVGGGSLIAIKINDGAYSHRNAQTARLFDANLGREVGACPAQACASNQTIWYTIEADARGSFDVDIPLPTRTDSVPAFGEGSYTLRIMTRTLSADPYYQGRRPDPSRTMKSPEFTVVGEDEPLDDVKPGRPSAAPDPLHATDDLVDAIRAGVSVKQHAKRWVVTVPAAAPGDWVYVNVYDGESPRFPWNSTWFEVDARHRVTLPLAGASLPTGTNKLSVQDRQGVSLGWTTVTVAAVKAGSPKPTISLAPTVLRVGQPRPESAPAQPAVSYAGLDDGNAGKVTGAESGGKLTITIPSVPGGHWVYLFLYTETGRVAGIDWVQVGTDHTITVEIGKLPDGIHKLALVDASGALAGWVTANGPAPLTPAEPDDSATADTTPAAVVPADSTANPDVPAPAGGGDSTMTLILLGLAVLVLAGSAAGVITLQNPVRPRT